MRRGHLGIVQTYCYCWLHRFNILNLSPEQMYTRLSFGNPFAKFISRVPSFLTLIGIYNIMYTLVYIIILYLREYIILL